MACVQPPYIILEPNGQIRYLDTKGYFFNVDRRHNGCVSIDTYGKEIAPPPGLIYKDIELAAAVLHGDSVRAVELARHVLQIHGEAVDREANNLLKGWLLGSRMSQQKWTQELAKRTNSFLCSFKQEPLKVATAVSDALGDLVDNLNDQDFAEEESEDKVCPSGDV